MRFNLLYCFLNSDNKERKYSTLFEALTKCYTPLGESPLWAVCWRQDQDSNSILLYLVKECEVWDRLESFSDMFIVPLMWLIMNWELTWVDTSRYHWTIQRRNSSNFLIATWWIGVDKIMFWKDFATFLLSYWQNYNGETRWI